MALYSLTTVVISEHEVLITGGRTAIGGESVNNTWLYDDRTQVYQERAMSLYTHFESTCGYVYMESKGKKVVLCLGNANENSAEIYDVENNVWEMAPQFSYPIHVTHAYAFIHEDRLVLQFTLRLLRNSKKSQK